MYQQRSIPNLKINTTQCNFLPYMSKVAGEVMGLKPTLKINHPCLLKQGITHMNTMATNYKG